jgi:transposase
MAQALAREPRPVAYGRTQDHFRPRTPRQSPRKREPCTAQLVRLLERSPSSAAQGFQPLREHGVTGGYSLVKAYGRTSSPRRQPACLTLACAPGEGAQVAWGAFGAVPGGHTPRRRRCFGMGRCYSRLLSVAVPVSQTLEPCLACHQHAVECVGGIPHNVMGDHLKSAVLPRARGAAPVFTPQYLDFAPHNGLTLAPGPVGKGNATGRVDNAVGDVTQNFLAALALPHFRALNPAARQWLDTVATARVPGETKATPTPFWPQERPSLRPLPLQPLAIAPVAQGRASRQFRIPLDTNRYAVPAHYAGPPLTRNTYPDRRCLSHGDTRIARQARRYDRFQDGEDPDPPKPLLEQRKQARAHQLFRRWLALSPRAEASDLKLEERRLTPHHPVRNIVAWSDLSPPAAVARAMDAALT